MLPVATPTNAVVFGTGYVTIKDLFISGIILKLFGIVVLFFSTIWLQFIFVDTSIVNTLIADNSTLLTTLSY